MAQMEKKSARLCDGLEVDPILSSTSFTGNMLSPGFIVLLSSREMSKKSVQDSFDAIEPGIDIPGEPAKLGGRRPFQQARGVKAGGIQG